MRRKRIKQRKIIILTSLSLLFVLTTGYAAFQTNLNITAKGNIKEKIYTPQELKNKYCNETDGDGLYQDIYEDGRCVYKGANPSNYITFNNETWRIISVEVNGDLKLIKNDTIGKRKFDSVGLRTTGYCNDGANNGCNAWSQTTNFINGTYKGAVDKDAELNTYLNTIYYSSFNSEAKSLIKKRTFNIAPITYEDKLTSETIQEEKEAKWEGFIALPTVSDHIGGNKKTICLTHWYIFDCHNDASNNNWIYNTLVKSGTQAWLLTPYMKYTNRVLIASVSGAFGYGNGHNSLEVVPVLYLTNDLKLYGDGTESSPYKINES